MSRHTHNKAIPFDTMKSCLAILAELTAGSILIIVYHKNGDYDTGMLVIPRIIYYNI